MTTVEDVRRKAKVALILRARSNPRPGRQVISIDGVRRYGLPIGSDIPPGTRRLTEKQQAEFASLTPEQLPRYFAARQGGLSHSEAYKQVAGSPRRAARPTKAGQTAVVSAPAEPPAAPVKKATKATKATPKTPPGPAPIADDIPQDVAWREGRRIYVRAGYRTPLDSRMRSIGAKWDAEHRALWVGTGKLERVLPLVRETQQYRQRTAEIKAGGRWVTIPFEAASIRAEAKRLGARWDPNRKQWALPDDDSLAKVQALLAERDERERRRREREQQAERQRRAEAELSQQERDRRIIAKSGRTVLGEPESAAGVLHGRMRKAEAEQAKPQPGEVIRLPDGRLALVLSSDVRFYNQDMIDDWLNPVGGTGAEPGWQYTFRFVPVAPTPNETARDERRRRDREDAEWLRTLRPDGEERPLAERPSGVTISGTSRLSGGSMLPPERLGEYTVTPDGEVWFYHPGRSTDMVEIPPRLVRITDAGIAERIRAIAAAGQRTIEARDRNFVYTYRIS